MTALVALCVVVNPIEGYLCRCEEGEGPPVTVVKQKSFEEKLYPTRMQMWVAGTDRARRKMLLSRRGIMRGSMLLLLLETGKKEWSHHYEKNAMLA